MSKHFVLLNDSQFNSIASDVLDCISAPTASLESLNDLDVEHQCHQLPTGEILSSNQYVGFNCWHSTVMDDNALFYALKRQGGGLWICTIEDVNVVYMGKGHLWIKSNLDKSGVSLLVQIIKQSSLSTSPQQTFQKYCAAFLEHADIKRKTLCSNITNDILKNYRESLLKKPHLSNRSIRTIQESLIDKLQWDNPLTTLDLPLSIGPLYENFLSYRNLHIDQDDWIWISDNLVMRLDMIEALDDDELRDLLQVYRPKPCPNSIVSFGNDERLLQLQIRVSQFGSHRLERIKKGIHLLHRWDGRRKATGSYYTPPDLAYSTVVKTLKPILKNATPNHILSLKVCDLSMGAGIFLVCAQRYLTQAFLESIVDHGFTLSEFFRSNSTFDINPLNEVSEIDVFEIIAANCIYGVDVNPDAVNIVKHVIPGGHFALGDALLGMVFQDKPEAKVHFNALLGSASTEQMNQNNYSSESFVSLRPVHFPLAFPDIHMGFDAIIGNPPWESHKPNVRSFFERYDPALRLLRRKRADDRINILLKDRGLSEKWRQVSNAYILRSQFFKHIGQKRMGPFRHQGIGDGNLWKLFLEMSHSLLKTNGALGLILPGNLVSDKGASRLRKLLIERSNWKWCYGFWNERKIFDIDSTYRFTVVIAMKGGITKSIQCRFFVSDLKEWLVDKPKCIHISSSLIRRFSPDDLIIQSLSSSKDISLLSKIESNSVHLNEIDTFEFGSGLHMTSHSTLMNPIQWWIERGFQLLNDARMKHPNGDVALPIYEGRMIDQYDACAKRWIKGRGRHAIWEPQNWPKTQLGPQFWINQSHVPHKHLSPRIGFKAISRPTIQRTMKAVYLDMFPAGNAVAGLWHSDTNKLINLLTILNSLPYDYTIKKRCNGLNLNWHLIKDSLVPIDAFKGEIAGQLIKWGTALSLSLGHINRELKPHTSQIRNPILRREIRIWIDVLVSFSYKISISESEHLCMDCEHSVDLMTNRHFRQQLDPKGFWKIDKDLLPKNRYTQQYLLAYRRFYHTALNNLPKALADGDLSLENHLKRICSTN